MPKVSTKVTKKQWRSAEGIIRRNSAERGRVRSMNEGFENLRKVIPFGEFKGKKKSKVQTLQGAIDHIKYLSNLLANSESQFNIFGPFSEELANGEFEGDSVENYSNYQGSIDGEGNSKSPNSSISEVSQIGPVSPVAPQQFAPQQFYCAPNSQMYTGYAPEYGWGYGYYPY